MRWGRQLPPEAGSSGQGNMSRAVAVDQMQSRCLLTLGNGCAVLRTMAAILSHVGLHTGAARRGCCTALQRAGLAVHAFPLPHSSALHQHANREHETARAARLDVCHQRLGPLASC